jgi:hypothetical protein
VCADVRCVLGVRVEGAPAPEPHRPRFDVVPVHTPRGARAPQLAWLCLLPRVVPRLMRLVSALPVHRLRCDTHLSMWAHLPLHARRLRVVAAPDALPHAHVHHRQGRACERSASSRTTRSSSDARTQFCRSSASP